MWKMVQAFDRIVVAVPDLRVAVAAYEQLLGVEAFPCTTAGGVSAAWLGLPNTVLELKQAEVEAPVIRGIVFSADAGETSTERPLDNALRLDISLGDGGATADFRRQQPASQCVAMRVDHLVLRTRDAQACIDFFADELGVRLALDRTVPEWGGRMLFFRVGKLTLEVIASDKDAPTGDAFWGIAYQCPDLEEVSLSLAGRGVSLSEIREGRKPGTRVASVKSHCLQIPTLLIEPAT
jgi:catechol 2,3-dioxygenase-like lactoylglutathione lyase family enzyme